MRLSECCFSHFPTKSLSNSTNWIESHIHAAQQRRARDRQERKQRAIHSPALLGGGGMYVWDCKELARPEQESSGTHSQQQQQQQQPTSLLSHTALTHCTRTYTHTEPCSLQPSQLTSTATPSLTTATVTSTRTDTTAWLPHSPPTSLTRCCRRLLACRLSVHLVHPCSAAMAPKKKVTGATTPKGRAHS